MIGGLPDDAETNRGAVACPERRAALPGPGTALTLAVTATTISPHRDGSLWARASVRVAIALAFADASVVVLALPQIVIRLHTSISHVSWVITAYNLALIAGTLAGAPRGPAPGRPRDADRRTRPCSASRRSAPVRRAA